MLTVILSKTKWSEESILSFRSFYLLRFFELRSHPFRLCQNDKVTFILFLADLTDYADFLSSHLLNLLNLREFLLFNIFLQTCF